METIHDPQGDAIAMDKFQRQIQTTIRHLSWSSVSSYLACPFSWYMNYIQKRPRPAVEPLMFGSAVHRTWADYVGERARGKSPDLLGFWHAEWSKEVSEAEKKGEGVDWRKGSAEDSFQDGLRIFDARNVEVVYQPYDQTVHLEHMSLVMDQFVPMLTIDKYSLQPAEPPSEGCSRGVPAVERFVEMFAKDIPKKLLGYVDWIGVDGIPCDLKTSGRSWSKGNEELELQPTLYIAMLEAKGHKLNPKRAFKHVVLPRIKKPKVHVLTSYRTEAQLRWMLLLIKRVWEDMSAGRITPNPTFQWCVPNYCDWWLDCRGKGIEVEQEKAQLETADTIEGEGEDGQNV